MSLSYHGFLGATEAEDIIRMSGAERGYLTRQSVIRPGFYILSFQEGGKILHHIAPNKEGRNLWQTYNEAALILKEMILAKEECKEPLSPPYGPVSEAPSQDNQSLKCRACSYTNEDRTKLYGHEKNGHNVKKCLNCTY